MLRGEAEALLGDLRASTAFLTRFPLEWLGPAAEEKPDFRRAARVFPLVGALVGIAGGIVLLLSTWLHIPPLIGAALAVLATMIASLTLMPAILGSRVGRRIKPAGSGDADRETGFASRWAGFVARRPWPVAVLALAILLALAAPALHMRLSTSDASTYKKDDTTRIAYDLLKQGFGAGFNAPLLLAVELQKPGDKALARKALQEMVKPDALKGLRPAVAVLVLFAHVRAQDATPAGRLAAVQSYTLLLERARTDLTSFMNAKCGLMNPDNPCRCPKKTAGLIREGWVDPERLRFVDRRRQEASRKAPGLSKRLEGLVADTPDDLFRSHPRGEGPDFAKELVRLFEAGLDVGNEQRIERCDKLDFDRVARTRLGTLATCGEAGSLNGVLSLGFDVDFAKNRVVHIASGKSTTLEPAEAQPLVACVEKAFADVNLEGLEHEASAYTLFYRVEFVPGSQGSEPESAPAPEVPLTPASGSDRRAGSRSISTARSRARSAVIVVNALSAPLAAAIRSRESSHTDRAARRPLLTSSRIWRMV